MPARGAAIKRPGHVIVTQPWTPEPQHCPRSLLGWWCLTLSVSCSRPGLISLVLPSMPWVLLIFLSSWAQLQSWQQSCLAGKAPPHWLHGIRETVVFFLLDAGWFNTSFAKFFHQGLGYRHAGELGWAGVPGQRNQRNSHAPSRDKGHAWCPPAPQGERVVDIAPSAWLPVLGAQWSSLVPALLSPCMPGMAEEGRPQQSQPV